MENNSNRAHDVFVSYSSLDKTWAVAACKVLEGNGVRCWIAFRDMPPGTEWGEQIINAIDASRVMVLIFSKNANDSAHVRREVEHAISNGVIILPVRVEDVRPQGGLEFALGITHWLDVFTPPVEKHLERIAQAALGILGRASTRPPRIPTNDLPVGPGPGPVRPAKSGLPIGVVVAASVLLTAAIVTGAFLIFPQKTTQPPPPAVAANLAVAEVAASPKPAPRPTPEAMLQGRWKVVDVILDPGLAATKKGQKMAGRVSSTFWTFRGNELTTSVVKDGQEDIEYTGIYSIGQGREWRLFDYNARTRRQSDGIRGNLRAGR
jgi:TIR domain